MSEEFVSPPSKKITFESKEEEFISPPSKNYIPENKGDDFVSPPKRNESTKEGFVKPRQTKEEKVEPITGNFGKSYSYNDPYENPRYFGTPKVGIRFYLTGYLFIMLYISFQSYGLQFWFLLLYTFLSNYTYSWFADYQRYKQGAFAWFFTPYGSLKTGWESSRFMNHQTATVSKGMFGSYKVSSHTSISETLFTFIMGVVITEVLKFMIVVPIAFISVFTHKSTIRKYNAAVDRNN